METIRSKIGAAKTIKDVLEVFEVKRSGCLRDGILKKPKSIIYCTISQLKKFLNQAVKIPIAKCTAKSVILPHAVFFIHKGKN